MRGPAPDRRRRYAFGRFELSADGKLLLRDGARVPLGPKVLQTLLALVERAGQVVTKDELVREVWPDSFVEESGLSRNVSLLRQALADETHTVIATVPRIGYRFEAAVELVDAPAEPGGTLDASPAPPGRSRSLPRLLVLPFRLFRDDPDSSEGSSARAGRERSGPGWTRSLVGRRAAVVVAFLSVLGSLLWLHQRDTRRRLARDELLPRATRLAAQGGYAAADELVRRAERVLPDDPRLPALRQQVSTELRIRTIPAGAEVFSKEYGDTRGEWRPLGRTPLEGLPHPRGYFRWRIVKPGFETLELAASAGALELSLPAEGEIPPGMVRVPATAASPEILGLPALPEAGRSDFLIDRFEVSNREFERFVASGGYERAELWDFELWDGERRVSWEEARARFTDSTGRTGPATWELGRYPEGQADLPVTGVSWYEAAAYAAFVGKRLPTVHHWFRAATTDAASHIVPASNFGGGGLWPAGSSRAMSAWGSYDMAGNAREWCWNATHVRGGMRYLLGAAWNEPRYVFPVARALSPFDRSAANGFRCALLRPGAEPASTAPVPRVSRDYATERPASEEVFAVLAGLHSYERRELNATVESVTDSGDWTVERVSFDAAYAEERVLAYLLLPKRTPPPFQTVVYFPSGNAFTVGTPEDLRMQLGRTEFLPETGRALLFPIYAGSYERLASPPLTVAAIGGDVWRDHVLRWSKDLSRSIDHLETRDDIDHARIAYLGISRGGALGPLLLALESRIRAAVLFHGGFFRAWTRPEVDPMHFAPRVKIPVLMLNARNDTIFPFESSQRPLFRLLGTRDEDKKHVLMDIGHVWPPQNRVTRETLEWLDRHLGPVR